LRLARYGKLQRAGCFAALPSGETGAPERWGFREPPHVIDDEAVANKGSPVVIVALIDGKTSKGKSEMRGSLRCAAHDEAVSSFGRDDAFFGV